MKAVGSECLGTLCTCHDVRDKLAGTPIGLRDTCTPSPQIEGLKIDHNHITQCHFDKIYSQLTSNTTDSDERDDIRVLLNAR